MSEQPWLCTTLLSSNYKHECVINIVFLLEPKHSIIRDTLKKTILSQLKLRQVTEIGIVGLSEQESMLEQCSIKNVCMNKFFVKGILTHLLESMNNIYKKL